MICWEKSGTPESAAASQRRLRFLGSFAGKVAGRSDGQSGTDQPACFTVEPTGQSPKPMVFTALWISIKGTGFSGC